jgi:hypothetical protein
MRVNPLRGNSTARLKAAAAGLALFVCLPGIAPASPAKNSCISCHTLLEDRSAEPAKLYPSDVHNEAGLTCADCHGGDPNDDSMNAMSPAKGFRGVPKKTQIPQFCGSCHSNGSYMRRFKPGLRTDQLSQYWTSIHGKRLLQGDTKVAACVDCHGVHNILAVSDARAPVYPTHVAGTCAHCHADAAYMKGYKIPTNQFALYQKSVHAQALAEGDTSAPTCNTCHGNHGAAPPGVSSVENVCGTCHVVNQQLFEKSPHQAAFTKMGLPGCVQCHSNHEILTPSDAWVGVGPKSTCGTCHTAGDKGYAAAQEMAGGIARFKTFYQRAEDILNTAERSGMEVSSAQVELTSAHESLIKARVAIHAFDPAQISTLTGEGVDTAKKAYQAGVAALKERDIRRKGLALSLIFVVLAIIGLYLKIQRMESRQRT